MNSTEILNGNLLIACFSDPTWKDRVDLSWENIEDYVPFYHEYWDYLMPVVEKINDLDAKFHINIYSAVVTVFSYSPIETLAKFNNNESSKIEAVWQAVIEFIKWYNKNNK